MRSHRGLTLADQRLLETARREIGSGISACPQRRLIKRADHRHVKLTTRAAPLHPRSCQDVFGPVSHTAGAASQRAMPSTMPAQLPLNPIGCLPETEATDPSGATQSQTIPYQRVITSVDPEDFVYSMSSSKEETPSHAVNKDNMESILVGRLRMSPWCRSLHATCATIHTI